MAVPEDPDQPSAKRKGRAGIVIVAIVLVIIVTIFVGYNIWHVDTLEEEQATGVKEVNGLS
ncbi:hypothetical protein [Novosphingobium soli]|uniref:Uncharacterized protein n=1 Tax=Novosphingobium soli TaxID=574956 RepID=A0ABV6CU91_9SPHN